mmetsp:Transcript_1459/g.5220  ORF Transcript_1459/g.5220 Transcript_1459/m.5220 type:complete len:243 (+) Transcript_1459:1074-1802(+)
MVVQGPERLEAERAWGALGPRAGDELAAHLRRDLGRVARAGLDSGVERDLEERRALGGVADSPTVRKRRVRLEDVNERGAHRVLVGNNVVLPLQNLVARQRPQDGVPDAGVELRRVLPDLIRRRLHHHALLDQRHGRPKRVVRKDYRGQVERGVERPQEIGTLDVALTFPRPHLIIKVLHNGEALLRNRRLPKPILAMKGRRFSKDASIAPFSSTTAAIPRGPQAFIEPLLPLAMPSSLRHP